MTALLRRMVERELLGRSQSQATPRTRSWHLPISAGAVGATSRKTTMRLGQKLSVTKPFVDTSAFYALADGGDRGALAAIIGTHRVTTSDHLVVQSWLLLCSRLGRRAAIGFWDGLHRASS
jgi:hypothetical protein